MSRRVHMSAADYVTIAVSPALIMTLIGSLVFFLIEVFYRGQYQARLNYVFALFIFAAVLIGRIAIEEGAERAVLFSAPLALAAFLVVNRFVQHAAAGPLINLGIIALIWWCAHKLTWDCTLIDDQQDASGEGLLRAAGLVESSTDGNASDGTGGDKQAKAAPAPDDGIDAQEDQVVPKGWWERYRRRRRRGHAPGVWIVYFSLVALPLFGLLQRSIPVGATDRRAYTFHLLVVYIASALGLLLTTGFLGLRRYLRQRGLEMPAPMAGTWIATGVALIVAVLVFTATLPRPAAEVPLARLPFHLTSPENLAANRHVPFRQDGTADDESKAGTSPDRTTADTDHEPSQRHDEKGEKRTAEGAARSERPGASHMNRGDKKTQPKRHSATAKNERATDGDAECKGAEDVSPEREGAKEKGAESENTEGKNAPGKGTEDKDAEGQGAEGKSAERNRAERNRAEGQETQGAGAESESAEGDDVGGNTGRRHREGRASAALDRAPGPQAQPSKRKQSTPAARMDQRPPVAPSRRLPVVLSPGTNPLTALFKLLFYGAVLVAAACVLWWNRAKIGPALAQLARELRQLWQSLWGRRASETVPDEGATPTPLPSRFADFRDPFRSGVTRGMAPVALVAYTLAAFQAWARDHGQPRIDGETTREWVRRAVPANSPLAGPADLLVDLHNRIAYAGDEVTADRASELRQLWTIMSASTQPPSPARQHT